jgi:hypothetical protein
MPFPFRVSTIRSRIYQGGNKRKRIATQGIQIFFIDLACNLAPDAVQCNLTDAK